MPAPRGGTGWQVLLREAACHPLLMVVGAVLLLRLVTLGAYPLMDTTEARYGEIARVMVETGNYITPQEIPGTPFWAKPPLYAWLSAASIQVLGVNEFALRLPSLLCALAVMGMCMYWAAHLVPARSAEHQAWSATLAALFLALCPGFFAASGAVMTDPVLTVCITAMLLAFHQAVVAADAGGPWQRIFFAAAGLGMLAKGPVIGLYAGLPIAAWIAWERRGRVAWERLPWVRGAALALLICAPWYVLAERRTPGFLTYFLLGEHVMRFVQPGWGGDLYGTAHAEPRGMIWAYQLGAVLLGLPLLVAALRARRRAAPADAERASMRLLLLAVLIPLAFFSLAGNIIWTYVLPGLGPLAVWTAHALAPRVAASVPVRRAVLANGIAGTAVLALLITAWVPRHTAAHSSAGLLAQWHGPDDGALLYVGRKAPASLRYYSRGAVRAVPGIPQALQAVAENEGAYIALAPDGGAALQSAARQLPHSREAVLVERNADLALYRLRPARSP